MNAGVMGILVGIVIVLAACSVAQLPPESKFAEVEGMRCTQVTPTGSHRARKVCTTRAEREVQSAEAKAELDSAIEYQRNKDMMDRQDHREITRP